MQKIKRFIKNYKVSVPVFIVVLIIIGFAATRGKAVVKSDTITAARGTVAQEVSVTGRVIPAQDVDLAVQSGGKVTSITAKVGQEVTAGQTLLRVDSADLQIRLGRQQAALAKAQITLNKGSSQTAEGDLKKAYDDGFSAIEDAFVDVPTIISEVHDMLYDNSYSPYLSDNNVRNTGDTAQKLKLDTGYEFDRVEDAYDVIIKRYQSFSRTASTEELESMLNETYALTKNLSDVIKDMRNLVKYISDRTAAPQPSEIARDEDTLEGYTTKVNSHLSEIVTVQNTIKNSRKGLTDESSDTQSNRIDIQQAQLDIQDTLVQISNRTIKSPVNGIVTKVDAEVGETISPSGPVISIISANQFEIEANIPEADMAKIAVGADTDVTLDAYGNDVVFKAKVVAIDPAETLVEGVATYRTTFQFVEKDERIKSGMTASIEVKGEQKENVIAVPQRSVITKNDQKFVQVLVGETIVDKPVQTGLRGSDGNIEITSGIVEGDKVVVFTEAK
ncbi:MAG: efflux RND transporter periplasmic adaptor subunit [Patescibacteria group bacterium]